MNREFCGEDRLGWLDDHSITYVLRIKKKIERMVGLVFVNLQLDSVRGLHLRICEKRTPILKERVTETMGYGF